ncbi:hypothetical protein GCM10022405_34300 [Gibbsiella dentisursi]|uniref:Uncharacterized protein n=1 Tax=Gibbsiella dentisursi TaxID=796890 RepID=A0ABP7LUC0_9GAMM
MPEANINTYQRGTGQSILTEGGTRHCLNHDCTGSPPAYGVEPWEKHARNKEVMLAKFMKKIF